MTDLTLHKPARRRVRRLIRAFKRTFPNAPPALRKKIIRSSYARRRRPSLH